MSINGHKGLCYWGNRFHVSRYYAVRLFIAVPTPEPVRAAAAAVIHRLRGPEGVSWVKPERLHLTLRFLGQVSAEQKEEIESAIAETANAFSRFVVQCGGAGAFPTVRRPRTIWLGFSGEGKASLVALAERLERRLEKCGFPREDRPFQPHLTLGRVKDPRAVRELARRLERETLEETDWPIDELHLVKSDLGPRPVYTILAHYRLR